MKKEQGHKRLNKIKLFAKVCDRFGKKITDTYIAAYSAQAAFFILLSVVPIVSLILSVTTYLPFSQQDVIDVLMNVIPGNLYSYVRDIIEDLYSRAGTTVISLSAVTLLWSASKGIAALMDGLNNMYDLREEYTPMQSRFLAVIYTVVFIILFAAVMWAYVIVSHYYKIYIHGVFERGSTWGKLFLLIRHALGWLLFYAFILALYVVLPGGFGLPMKKEEKINLSNRIRSQMPGAAFASVAWLVVTGGVQIYIKYFPSISVMYGSLAGIVIIMLWLYFCMYSIFIGAVINYMLANGYLTRVKKMLQ